MIIRLMMQLLFLNSCSVVQTAEKTVQVHSTTKAENEAHIVYDNNFETRIKIFRKGLKEGRQFHIREPSYMNNETMLYNIVRNHSPIISFFSRI